MNNSVTSGNLVTIDFTTPMALRLDDQVSLRAIHAKLIEMGGLRETSNFRDWVKKKLEYYTQDTDFTAEEKTSAVISGTYGDMPIEYYTSVQVAMEVVANGHKKAGHQMRHFMSECVRTVAENKIQLPFDLHNPLSILEWSAKVFKEEHTLRLAAETKVSESTSLIQNKPVLLVRENGLTSNEIMKQYPALLGYMYEKMNTFYWRFKCKDMKTNGKLTTFLRSFGKLPSVKSSTPLVKYAVTLFSKEDVEHYLEKLRKEDKQ